MPRKKKINNYQKTTLKRIFTSSDKIPVVKSMSKKYNEVFDNTPEYIDEYLINIIKEIKKKVGIPIPDDIKTRIVEKSDNYHILGTNLNDKLYIFLNDGNNAVFFILNESGMITYSKVFIGNNFNFNIKFKQVKKKRSWRRRGSVEWAVDEFISTYYNQAQETQQNI